MGNSSSQLTPLQKEMIRNMNDSSLTSQEQMMKRVIEQQRNEIRELKNDRQELYRQQHKQQYRQQQRQMYGNKYVQDNLRITTLENQRLERQRQQQYQRQQQELRKQQQEYQRQQELRKQQLEEKRQQQEEQQKLKYQKERRNRFVKELDELKIDKVDPYHLFSLDKNFTLDQLKKTYKKYALKYHPDRPEGDEYKFKVITKVYMFLYEEYKKRETDKQFNDLRNESKTFMDKQNRQQQQHIRMDKDKFDIDLFNKIYTENKLFDPSDDGYGDWMKTECNKPQNEKLFSRSFNSSVFNTVFNDEKNNHYNNNKEVVEYKDPDAQSTSIDHSVLGQDKIKDFSSGQNKNVQYSDLKKAYNNPYLIDSRNVDERQHQSINHLKNERSNISYVMSESDMERRQTMNDRLNAEEEFRRGRVREHDRAIEEHYNKVNQMFLKRF